MHAGNVFLVAHKRVPSSHPQGMPLKRCILATLSFWLAFAVPAFGWGKKGHEVVAYIAYMNLDDPTQKEVDYLVSLNPCYAEWKDDVKALPANQHNVALFMLAATWPDAIKQIPHQPAYDCQPGHKFIADGAPKPGGGVNVDVPPSTLEASQNIGYNDERRHQYWHFVDTGFSKDGTTVTPAYQPNALTELVLLESAMKAGEDSRVKSYDLVWIEHLVGDLHQPLHDTTRFTANHPQGDAGGNDVLICETENCTRELHGYWDDLPGPGNDLAASITMGESLLKSHPKPSDDLVNVDDPQSWLSEGFSVAKQYAYAAPVTTDAAGSSPANLNPEYEKNAKNIVADQLALAGYRLAALLNEFAD